MTAVSPFARSSAFEDSLTSGREQTVRHPSSPAALVDRQNKQLSR